MTPVDPRELGRDRRARRFARAFLAAIAGTAIAASVHADPVKLVSLRADSSNGAARLAGAEGPWLDLTGHGHDAIVTAYGNRLSGWNGNGTVGSPYRLELAGDQQLATIPAGSVPELQTVGPVSAEVWFRSGFDGPQTGQYQYLLEWLQTGDRGMSIAMYEQSVMVYLNGWVPIGAIAPDSWHHVAVAKDSAEVRLYLDGQRMYTGAETWNGIQQTPITIGASIFRQIDGTGTYGDYLHGAIAQVDVWSGALSDSAVAADFAADQALYQPADPLPTPTRVVSLTADHADGLNAYTSPGISESWVDIQAEANAQLANFDGSLTSGWLGDGSPGSPHRLAFDGIDDVAVLAPMAVTALADAHAVSAELWFQAPANVADANLQFMLDWYGGLPAPQDMSIALGDGALQVDVGAAGAGFQPIAPIAANSWHHVIVAKQPGEVRVYLDGQRVYSGTRVLFTPPYSNVAIGASTYGGDGVFADRFDGAIAQVHLWLGAVDDSLAQSVFNASAPNYTQGTLAVAAVGTPLALAGMRPNPASGPLAVAFALPSSEPAQLQMMDVTGRVVRSMNVGALGAGRHVVQLGHGREVAAGVYWLRLTQHGQALTTKATIVH